VHNKIPVSECIISETGIYTNCGRGSISLTQKGTTTYEITIGQNQYSSITLQGNHICCPFFNLHAEQQLLSKFI
ncbi:hypothetical protein Q7X32_11480, partial [Glaesserella parasuis]|nr:hypothetical protein [Glaesserella parasuis]